MKARKIIGNALIALTVLFTVWLSAVMLRRISGVVLKGAYVNFFLRELAICAVFILLALDVRFGFLTKLRWKTAKAAGWVLRGALVLAAAVLLFLMGKVVVGGFVNTSAPAGHAIVLGLALENGQPTPDLIARLDTAEDYARQNPEAVLILTGGNPDESGRTEAAAMRDILLERGLPAERMILEDKAADTRANFRNTAALISPDAPAVLISSNYHMDRAVQTARSAGFTHVLRLPAPSSWVLYGPNMMWEVVTEITRLTARPRPAAAFPSPSPSP